MNERAIPQQRQASDQGFESLGKPSTEKREAMLLLAIHAAEVAIAHYPDFDLERDVSIPYAGTVRLASLFELREE
jgi:hypothetical protein